MMKLFGPRHIHGAQTPKQFADAQRQTVAQLAARLGDARGVHSAEELAAAFVNHGRWVISCPECYGGAAVDVGAGEARCFECGAVYTVDDGTLKLPKPSVITAIDAVLGERRHPHTRNWTPGESIRALQRENTENGIAGPKSKGRP